MDKLLPVDSQITQQTKQIKEIFGLLERNNGDNSPSVESKKENQSKRVDHFEQKPALLQNTLSSPSVPAHIKDKMKNGGSNNMDGQLFKPSTPPSSCQDLLSLGHTFDGLFLVKNKRTKIIQTVFCQFSSDNQGRMITTMRIGNLNS